MNGTTFQLGVTFVVLILPAAVTILWVRKYKATGTASSRDKCLLWA